MQFIQIRKTDPKKLYVKYTVDEGLNGIYYSAFNEVAKGETHQWIQT
jgi:hypothetical protein